MNYDELKALIEQRGVHPALGPTGQGWGIEQNPHELAVFLEDVLERGVHKVLEIGSGHRMGLSRLLANDLGMQVVSIDRQEPQFTAPNVQFLMGSSEILRPLFEGAQFDLVIIDGDNTYEGVAHDHEQYAPIGRIEAICKIGGLRGCEGVKQYWDELTVALKTAPTLVYDIAEKSLERSGIGWIVGNGYEDLDDVIHEAVEPEKYTLEPNDTWLNEPTIVEDEPEIAAKPEPQETAPRKTRKTTKRTSKKKAS